MNTDRIPGVTRFRNRAYTGQNRCLPCTALNAGIALVLGIVAAVLTSAVVAGAVVAVAAVVIYLRGYLIPYTPTITKRYFPDRVLEWFDKREPAADVGGEAAVGVGSEAVAGAGSEAATDTGSEPAADVGDETAADVGGETAANAGSEATADTDGETAADTDGEAAAETPLASLGLVEGSGEDVRLVLSFATEWRAEIDETREGLPERLADRLDLSDPEVRTRDGVCAVLDGDTEVTRWLSEAALIADVAALPVLDSHVDDWESLPETEQSEILAELRVFLEECPSCESRLLFDTEIDGSSCCYDREVTVYRCSGCNASLTRLR